MLFLSRRAPRASTASQEQEAFLKETQSRWLREPPREYLGWADKPWCVHDVSPSYSVTPTKNNDKCLRLSVAISSHDTCLSRDIFFPSCSPSKQLCMGEHSSSLHTLWRGTRRIGEQRVTRNRCWIWMNPLLHCITPDFEFLQMDREEIMCMWYQVPDSSHALEGPEICWSVKG